jgi:hypothetical protein
MGLIKNAVEQGKQAISYLASNLKNKSNTKYDVVIVGAGPAVFLHRLKQLKIKFVLEQILWAELFQFPRAKL